MFCSSPHFTYFMVEVQFCWQCHYYLPIKTKLSLKPGFIGLGLLAWALQLFFLPPLPPLISLPLLLLSWVSLIFCVTVLTQHFPSLSSVSARSCPGALTASFGQCPSLFASPPRFGNPGIAGNRWWIRTMRSLSLFSLVLPPPPQCKGDVGHSKTMEAFSVGLIWAARQTKRQTGRETS